jgi:hypothetical protein
MSYVVLMCPATYNPASCEIRAVIRFLQVKNMSAAEIRRELYSAVYSQNIISEGTVRQWCKMLKDGQKIFTMKSEVVGRPSVVSDALVQSLTKKFMKDCASQFQHFI